MYGSHSVSQIGPRDPIRIGRAEYSGLGTEKLSRQSHTHHRGFHQEVYQKQVWGIYYFFEENFSQLFQLLQYSSEHKNMKRILCSDWLP